MIGAASSSIARMSVIRGRGSKIAIQAAYNTIPSLALGSHDACYLSEREKRNQNQARYLSVSSKAGFENIGVVGLGLMGHGICQVSAMSGAHKSIIAYEPEQKYLDSGRTRIEKSVDKLVSKGKFSSEDATTVLNRIEFTTDVTKLANVDFVCEAVIENMDLKKRIYQQLSDVCQPDCIFGSNTSSLSITKMAEATNRPEKFVGMHFFNPVQLMALVEVISTKYTDPVVMDRAVKWTEDIGKVCVTCGDTPGFIVNRLLVPFILQSLLMLDRNDACMTDIDVSMKLGAGHPMGPIHLADYIGLDTCYNITKGWVEDYPNEPAFVMPQCLKEMVERGDLGRKTGKGFYYWDGDKRQGPVEQYSKK